MRVVVLTALLILTACGSAPAPQARASIPARATPTAAVVASPTPALAMPTRPPIPGPSATPTPALNQTGKAWVVTHVRGADCGAAVSGWSPCFVGVSCPTSALCVAVGAAGDVITSTDPTGGPSTWTVTRVDGSNVVTAISCPSNSFCAAVDQVGNVVTSRNPTGGASAWTVTHIDGSNCGFSASTGAPCFLTGVSCPTADLCVAVDANGNVVTSRKPVGTAADWTLSHVAGSYLSGVSCPSANLCVAVDIVGDVVTSVNPTDATAWRLVHVDGANCVVTETGAPCYLSSVSCPSTGLCVAVDESGNVISSTNPSGGSSAWKVTNLIGGGGLYDPYSIQASVSCPTSGLCIAVGNDDNARGFAIKSAKPTGDQSAWSRTAQIGGSVLSGVSCPSESNLCVAVTFWGDIVTTAI